MAATYTAVPFPGDTLWNRLTIAAHPARNILVIINDGIAPFFAMDQRECL